MRRVPEKRLGERVTEVLASAIESLMAGSDTWVTEKMNVVSLRRFIEHRAADQVLYTGIFVFFDFALPI